MNKIYIFDYDVYGCIVVSATNINEARELAKESYNYGHIEKECVTIVDISDNESKLIWANLGDS